jgi:glycosyltransferase involved in cell wall biosynthesis
MHIVMMLASGNAQMTGGVPSATLLRAQVYKNLGHRVTVICAGHPKFETMFWVKDIPIIPARPRDFKLRQTWEKIWTHPFLPSAQKRELLALHERTPIDMIEIQDGQCILACESFAKKHKIPLVYMVHGTSFGKQAIPKISQRYWKWVEKKAATSADIVTPPSYHLKSYHDRLWDTENFGYFVVHNPIPQDGVRDQAPAHPSKYFLAMGRMESEKRFHLAIEAFAKIADRTDHKLLLVGDGRLRSELIALAESKHLGDRIEFSDGAIRDRQRVLDLVAEAAAVILPSHDEGCPLALLEAIASSTPVVACDLKFNQEILGRQYPFYFDWQSTDSLAETMLNISLSDRRQFVKLYEEAFLLNNTDAYEQRIELLIRLVQRRQFDAHKLVLALDQLEGKIVRSAKDQLHRYVV